jgi:hypothetical protein
MIFRRKNPQNKIFHGKTRTKNRPWKKMTEIAKCDLRRSVAFAAVATPLAENIIVRA